MVYAVRNAIDRGAGIALELHAFVDLLRARRNEVFDLHGAIRGLLRQ